MKKILPMSDPIIRNYPFNGHVFAILGAYTDFHLPWAYNYFANIYAFEMGNGERRLEYVKPDIYTYAPGLRREIIARDIALETWNGILNFVRCYIDHEYYVFGLMDVSKISAWGKKDFFPHDAIIYGYDDEKEEIYFADNYKHGRYAFGIATYEEIVNATEWSWREDVKSYDWLRGFWCLKYTGAKPAFRFDKDLYAGLLSDYLEEKVSFYRWMLPGYNRVGDENLTWGIGTYGFLQESIARTQRSKEYIDKRAFYIQQEHKKILKKTFDYLYGEAWKQRFPVEWQLLEKDIEMTTITLNLCLKYNITREERLLDKIRNYLVLLEANDRELFPHLINLVQHAEPHE